MRGLVLLVVTLSCLSCTRGAIPPKMKLTIGTNSGNSGLSADDYLSLVIWNVQVPGKPRIVGEKEYHDGTPITMGQPIVLEFDQVPTGITAFMQILAVYENQTNGAMKFLYADAKPTIAANGEVVMTADNVGSSNKMVRLAGRYLTHENPDSGPTGVMIAQFIPKNDPTLAMDVKADFMVDGWFQAFTIDSATSGFRYVLGDGTVIFSNLRSDSSFLTPSPRLLQVIKPVSARRENRGDSSTIRVAPETNMYLGFFLGDLSASAARYTCYVSGITEGVPGTYTSAAMTAPLVFNSAGSGALATEMRIAGGGTADSYGVFAGTSTPCSPTNQDNGRALIFLHHNADDEEGFGGFSVPFMAMRPLNRHRSFLTADTDITNPADPKWILHWKYLPGADTTLTATEIWYKRNSGFGGDGGNDGDRKCESLIQEGYSFGGETLTSASPNDSFTFNGHGLTYDPVAPSDPSVSNFYMHNFMACAYRTFNGKKQYIGRPAQGDCLTGSCGNFDHFGWGTQDYAPGGAINFSSHMGGVSQRITGVTVTPNYTQVAVGNGSGFVAGKEVMLVISGASSGTGCGMGPGTGNYDFTRVLTTGSTPKLPRGTFLDTLGTAANLSGSPTSSDFCYIQMVQVPHYHNLDLNSSNLVTTGFDYAGSGGGIIAFRVNGTLNLGTSGNSISVVGKGYPGGVNTLPNGAGHLSAASSTYVNGNSGGQNGAGASGGAGAVGMGGSANGTPGSNTAMGGFGSGGGGFMVPLIFGGGGSGVGGGGDANGGGAVFIMANKITSFGGAIYADGGTHAGFYSGAGAGTINVITRELTGLGSGGVNFLASGSSGDVTGGSYGGGGGGAIAVIACKNDLSGSTNFNVAPGSGGGSPAGSSGSNGYGSYTGQSNFWMCK